MDTSHRTTSTSRTGRRGPPLRWAQKVARCGRLRGLLASTTRKSRRRRGQRLRAAGARGANASRRPLGAQRKGSTGGHPRPRRAAACCPLAHRPGSHPRTWATPTHVPLAGERRRVAHERGGVHLRVLVVGVNALTAEDALHLGGHLGGDRALKGRGLQAGDSAEARPAARRSTLARRARRPAGAINRVVGGISIRRGRRGTGRARRGAARGPKA